MESKRFLATIPKSTSDTLEIFASRQGVHESLIVQRAITKMSEHAPTEKDVTYDRGSTVGKQITLSDTAYRLLELWGAKTGLSKSKLVTYSLQQTIVKKGTVE